MKHLGLWICGALALLALACSETPAGAADAAAETGAVDASTGTQDVVAAGDVAPPDAATPDVEYPPLTKGIWTQITVPAAPNTSLHGVWTDGTTRVALAGTNGSVIVNDGLGWKVATQGKFPTLNGVAGGKGAGHTFAVGVGGTIIGGKGQDGAPGLNWGPPGGCTKPADCDDKDPCTADSCDGGVCGHEPSGGLKCCGGVHFADSFDKGLGNWTVSDSKPPPQGGIVWKAAQMTGKDGGARATSPPNAAYFGLTNVPCDAGSGFCGTFDNGNVVGSTLLRAAERSAVVVVDDALQRPTVATARRPDLGGHGCRQRWLAERRENQTGAKRRGHVMSKQLVQRLASGGFQHPAERQKAEIAVHRSGTRLAHNWRRQHLSTHLGRTLQRISKGGRGGKEVDPRRPAAGVGEQVTQLDVADGLVGRVGQARTERCRQIQTAAADGLRQQRGRTQRLGQRRQIEGRAVIDGRAGRRFTPGPTSLAALSDSTIPAGGHGVHATVRARQSKRRRRAHARIDRALHAGADRPGQRQHRGGRSATRPCRAIARPCRSDRRARATGCAKRRHHRAVHRLACRHRALRAGRPATPARAC